MQLFGRSALKFAAVLVALLFMLGAMLTAVAELFGGSKVRPLFGMSADALAEPTTVEKRPRDGGTKQPTYFNATKSAPLPPPSRAKDAGQRVYFPASKSMGGEVFPGVEDALNPAPPPSPQQTPQQQAP